jgi:hypothetical protein
MAVGILIDDRRVVVAGRKSASDLVTQAGAE